MATPAATPRKPLFVGEQNPYGDNPEFALYPAPDGCSGHRLCCLILGMRRTDYLREFERCNLCDGPWNPAQARARATELGKHPALLILLGAKVARAFGLSHGAPFEPFTYHPNERILVLPHPSGLNRLWNEPNAFDHARRLVADVCPHLAHLLGATSPSRAPCTVDEEDE